MTCKIKKIETNFYLPEKDEIYNYCVDQTVIIREDFLNCVSEYKKPIFRPEINERSFLEDWFPYVNSYYPYTEDVDAFARVSHLLGSKPSFVSLSSEGYQSQDSGLVQDRVPYSENAAQLHFLESNPFSFIILGKPGIGEQELGKQLAEYWQCVYIDPETIIQQEIFSGSRAGQCIQFNLKCGRAIGIDVILRLVEKRVKSESAKHRGFVICGLPLIPNDLYQEDPISSESAVFTVKEIFEEMLDSTLEKVPPDPAKPNVSVSSKYKSEVEVEGEVESEAEEENILEEKVSLDEEDEETEEVPKKGREPKPFISEVPVDTGPDYDICHVPEIGTNYEDQLNFIFDLLKPPFMIIYIMCSTADVIEKRQNYRYDVESKQTINLQTEQYNNILFNYFSGEKEINEIPEDFLEGGYMHVDTSLLNYLVKLPRHFPANVATQLDSFHYTGLNFIERRVLMHDPQYFLKVDGRVSIQRMLNLVKSRLKVLPIQNVIIPTRLDTDTLDDFQGEDSEEKTHNMSLLKWYNELCRKQVPSSMYKWYWSDWGIKCPVALKNGILKDGDPTFAVHFMNKIFFLANEENYFKFYRNPRPYLLPPCPKPTCKVFVLGPRFTGKTTVSRCLSYFLNGTVLSITEMLTSFFHSRVLELKEKIRQAAIAEAMKILDEQRTEEARLLEEKRIQGIKEWLMETKALLQEYISGLTEKEHQQPVTSFELSSFPIAMKRVSLVEAENPLALHISQLKEQLRHRIPVSNRIDDMSALLFDKRKLLNYIPNHLRSKATPKPATVFDEFVIEYAKMAVQNADVGDTSLSKKNLTEIIVNQVKIVEDEQIQQGNNRGGWILDGMFCDQLLFDELYPDYIADEIIVLLEDPESESIIDKIQNQEVPLFAEYRDFFVNIGKLDAAWRSPSIFRKKSSLTDSDIVREILSGILKDSDAFDYGKEDPEANLEAYRQEIINFNEKWTDIKTYLLDHNIEPVEVKISEKSITDIMKEVIKKIEDRYRVSASVYTELDRAEDVKNFGTQMLQENISEGADMTSDESFQKNRRYGDTYDYCPVTFHDKWILWKGKEDYAVKFENKLYLLSSEEDMKNFLDAPRNYLSGEPPKGFPPPRICIVGVAGTCTTNVAKALAKNYGLYYVNFDSLLKEHFHLNDTESIDELRRNQEIDESLYQYLNEDVPFFEEVLRDSMRLPRFWYEQSKLGFVLENFPKRPSDVKFMTKYKLIPDLIIYLTNNDSTIKTQLVKQYMDQWEVEINTRRNAQEDKNKLEHLEWEEKRKTRFDELMEIKKEERYASKIKAKTEAEFVPETAVDGPALGALKEVEEETDKSGFVTDSQVSFDSVAEQDDINDVNKMLNEEIPEPIFQDLLETTDEANDRFEALATDIINTEVAFIKNIKSLCTADNILFSEILCDFDYPERIVRSAFIAAEKYKFRNRSHFERCYDVSMELAERLLSSGYFFLSKFGKTCPVQYHENKIPIQMYIPMEQNYNLFPVVHRSYIYYLVGRENQAKFKEDPLKYILIGDFRFPLITFKIAVSGPPKCGKTILATRISTEYGFRLISRGMATRYVLTYLPLSDLAKRMESVLRKGWELTDEMVVKCVEAACFDPKAVTQGVVFDGFPNTITEVRNLSYVGLVPHLTVDLLATQDEILQCLSYDNGRRGLPRFSEKFVEHLFEEWQKGSGTFSKWFDREYQETAHININTSIWSIWVQTEKLMLAVFFEIKHYFIHIPDEWPLRLANMQITPLEFLERQSSFKGYCPCCLHFFNSLTCGGDPPDRTGLVQYREFFYWLCSDHIETFLSAPDTFIMPYNHHVLPQNLPTSINLKSLPDNIFSGGICIVCCKQKTLCVKGNIKYAIEFNSKVHIFDSEECYQEFSRDPQKYMCDIMFKPPENYPSLNYRDLPVIGMLEQYVADDIKKALSFVARRRPVIPGLSVQASALIGMGLYLKMYNSNIPEEYRSLYKEADDLYHERRTKLINYLDRMKSTINPFLHYEEPFPKFEFPESIKSESTESIGTAMAKVVDEIIDNVDYTSSSTS